MEDAPSTAELAGAAGISKSYASEILSGKRKPSRALAIHILRATGWRHRSIAGLDEGQLATLEDLEPFTPRIAMPDAVALCGRCGERTEASLVTSCTSVHCPMRAVESALDREAA